MTDSISLDSDAAAQAAADWAAYGDAVEAHGRRHHMTLEQLQATVGDTYAPFVAAKHAEMQARKRPTSAWPSMRAGTLSV